MNKRKIRKLREKINNNINYIWEKISYYNAIKENASIYRISNKERKLFSYSKIDNRTVKMYIIHRNNFIDELSLLVNNEELIFSKYNLEKNVSILRKFFKNPKPRKILVDIGHQRYSSILSELYIKNPDETFTRKACDFDKCTVEYSGIRDYDKNNNKIFMFNVFTHYDEFIFHIFSFEIKELEILSHLDLYHYKYSDENPFKIEDYVRENFLSKIKQQLTNIETKIKINVEDVLVDVTDLLKKSLR